MLLFKKKKGTWISWKHTHHFCLFNWHDSRSSGTIIFQTISGELQHAESGTDAGSPYPKMGQPRKWWRGPAALVLKENSEGMSDWCEAQWISSPALTRSDVDSGLGWIPADLSPLVPDRPSSSGTWLRVQLQQRTAVQHTDTEVRWQRCHTNKTLSRLYIYFFLLVSSVNSFWARRRKRKKKKTSSLRLLKRTTKTSCCMKKRRRKKSEESPLTKTTNLQRLVHGPLHGGTAFNLPNKCRKTWSTRLEETTLDWEKITIRSI